MQMEREEEGEVVEHLYNAWLPVAQEARSETQRFHDVVGLLQLSWEPEKLQSRFGTIKWIPVITM